jgi:hypothetical protein
VLTNVLKIVWLVDAWDMNEGRRWLLFLSIPTFCGFKQIRWGKKKEQLSCFPLLLSLCECNSLQNSEKKHNEQLHLFFLQQSYLRTNIPCWFLFTKAIYVYISDIHDLFHVAFGVCYVIGSNSKMLWFHESWVTNNSR